MAIITRKDGTKFISPDFRERLTGKKASLLKSEVSILGKSYGELIYIQKNTDNSFEVAFSEEQGFLLAESVSKHLRAFESFIFREEIKYTNKIALVVMKEGQIQRDDHVIAESLHDELAIISADDTQYDFYVFGNIKISDNNNDNDSFNVSDMAKSFTIMNKSVIEELPRFNEYELLNLNDAFKRAGISIGISKKTGLIIFFIFIAVLCWFLFPREKTQIKKISTGVQTITVKSKYYDYAYKLHQPTVSTVTGGIMRFSALMYDLPAGWKVSSISGTPTKIVTLVRNDFPVKNYGVLQNWATENRIKMDIENSFVKLTYNSAYPRRGLYRSVYKINNVLQVVLDRLQATSNQNNITFNKPKQFENFYEQTVIISFTNEDADAINAVAKQLSDLPILFDKIDLSQANNGLYSGSMKITIIGD